MRVNAQIFAVNGNSCIAATRSRRACRVVKCIAHRLTHQADVLLIVVKGKHGQAVYLGLLIDMVELDLE